jgi:hypothetical protein
MPRTRIVVRRSRDFEAALRQPPPRPKVETRKSLISMARRGGITLVVGAGVSVPRRVPNWEYLARAMWKSAFGKSRSPWAVGRESLREVPQFLPIVFELVYRQLGEAEFIKLLRKNLYAHVNYPIDDKTFKSSTESLAVIARLLLREYHRKAGRRIDSVITLNADDLIEQAVNTLAGHRTSEQMLRYPIVRSIARSTHLDPGGRSIRPIPIYHIHGFLPSGKLKHVGSYDHMFVFTDAQYWSTSASALTFANRVMSWALNEGRCIFMGLSMTDINLLRWLALRTLEMDRDFAEAVQNPLISPTHFKIMRSQFGRHFWIRPRATDPSGFLSKFLWLRGIESVQIGSWQGIAFERLLEKCFPREVL